MATNKAIGRATVAGAAGVVATLAEFQAWCERDEQTLRNQYPQGELPPFAELALTQFTTDTLLGAMRRWAYLKHLFFSRAEGLEKAGDAEDASAVARQLLRREPVRVELLHRTVEVTGRSYGALAEIAAHAGRLAEIDLDLRRATELEHQVLTEIAAGGTARRRNFLRRRFRRLGEIHRRALVEATLHRKAIYAHAFTEDGAPASSLDEAPSWWDTLGPADDALLIAAVWEAGVGRYSRLGSAPEGEGGSSARAEDWGWASCFSAWERHLRVAPAALYDRDLAQLSAWMRSSATAAASDDEVGE